MVHTVYRHWVDADGNRRKDVVREWSVCITCKFDLDDGVPLADLLRQYAPPPEVFTRVAPPPVPAAPPPVGVPVQAGRSMPLGKPKFIPIRGLIHRRGRG